MFTGYFVRELSAGEGCSQDILYRENSNDVVIKVVTIFEVVSCVCNVPQVRLDLALPTGNQLMILSLAAQLICYCLLPARVHVFDLAQTNLQRRSTCVLLHD